MPLSLYSKYLTMIMSYSTMQQLLPMIIEGKVFCDSNIPVGGAHVYFVPRLEDAITTDKGEFKITTWMPLPITLVVCHKNYESCKLTISNTTKTLEIKLKQK